MKYAETFLQSLLGFGLSFILVILGAPVVAQGDCFVDVGEGPTEPPLTLNLCPTPEIAYTPDQTTAYQNSPILVLKVRYHFVRPSNGSGLYANVTWSDVEAEVAALNAKYATFEQPIMPVGSSIEFIPDSRIRFEIDRC